MKLKSELARTLPGGNTVGYFKFCITNHLKSKIQSVCIVLIKDKNCNTVCTSPEGGMDIQIKTLHRKAGYFGTVIFLLHLKMVC
jgi:succinyl-CoA synthetase beta subunit